LAPTKKPGEGDTIDASSLAPSLIDLRVATGEFAANMLRVTAGGKSEWLGRDLRRMGEHFEAASRDFATTNWASIAIAEALRAPEVEHKNPARLAVLLAEESVIQAALRIRAAQLVAHYMERATAVRELMAAVDDYQRAWAKVRKH
jgi:hypothetical protein